MKNNVTKFYLVLVVIAALYIVFSMFSDKKVLGRQDPVQSE
ncbi:MAG: hypothetical protein V4598_00480 [Bdellovibrionota bacterium]